MRPTLFSLVIATTVSAALDARGNLENLDGKIIRRQDESLTSTSVETDTVTKTETDTSTTAETPPHSSATPADVTAVSECHMHGSDVFCLAGPTEFHVEVSVTATSDLPAEFTGCHNHGDESFCVGPDGEDVEIIAEGAESEEHGHDEDQENGTDGTVEGAGSNCHYHAGVLHCPGASESAESALAECRTPRNEYNMSLRVGLLFAILVTSAIGVFGPILLKRAMSTKSNVWLVVLRQFGTGVIVSTAFVHLFTHASLMFTSPCLGELAYEATAAAILMAGLFLSFVVEYAGQRVVRQQALAGATPRLSTEVVGVLVMEAGIIFHSILIGLTLVVTPDDGLITLFVVILFHQVFEGLALGSRIANVRVPVGLGTAAMAASDKTEVDDMAISRDGLDHTTMTTGSATVPLSTVPLPTARKLALASAFALVTPTGMAIGMGVLGSFNGNDGPTLIAIGTLDALSAGILVWVGVVEMWAGDWMGHGGHGHHGGNGELADAPIGKVALAGLALMAGMTLMSLLGKWA